MVGSPKHLTEHPLRRKLSLLSHKIENLQAARKRTLNQMITECLHQTVDLLRYQDSLNSWAHWVFCKRCGLQQYTDGTRTWLFPEDVEIPVVSDQYAKQYLTVKVYCEDVYVLEYPMRHSLKRIIECIDRYSWEFFAKHVNRNRHVVDGNSPVQMGQWVDSIYWNQIGEGDRT